MPEITAQPNISIHAPREGDDATKFPHPAVWAAYFNPRPPRGGRPFHDDLIRYTDYISIHAPREGDDRYLLQKAMSVFISIHAPREGDDR